jgi:hypothetical protein
MARSKQAIPQASRAAIHEAFTMWIISGINRVVYRRNAKNPWSIRVLDKLLQKRHGSPVFAPDKP